MVIGDLLAPLALPASPGRLQQWRVRTEHAYDRWHVFESEAAAWRYALQVATPDADRAWATMVEQPDGVCFELYAHTGAPRWAG